MPPLSRNGAIEKCRHYLLGNPGFEVVTDHNPLVGTFTKHLGEIDNRRLQRMRECVLGYQFTVRWVAGKQHLMADALSRYPVDTASEAAHIAAAIAVIPADLVTFSDLASADPTYPPLLDAVRDLSASQLRQQGGQLAKDYLSVWDRLSITEVTPKPLVKLDTDRLVAPPSL